MGFQKIGALFERVQQERAAAKVVCFHCGERIAVSRAVITPFAGKARSLCCHGCSAILKTVEQMNMQEQYLEQKAREGGPHEE